MMTASLHHLFYFAAKVCGADSGALPNLYEKISCPDGATPQITSLEDVGFLLANIVRILIAVSGSLAVILLLVASIYYITAMGDPSRIRRAKDIILYTVVGLALIILSYSLITYIAGEF